MGQIIIDTNALLRFLLNDVPEQKQQASVLFQKAKSKQIILIISQIVIFEATFTLKSYYKFKKNQIIKTLNALVKARFLEVEERALFIKALKIYGSQNISFVDAFLLAKSRSEKSKVYTFDQKLNKIQTDLS